MEICRQFFNNFSSFFQKFLVLERFSVIVTHLLSFLTKTCTTYSFYTKTINNTNYSRSTEMHTFLEEKKWFFTHRKERKGIIHFDCTMISLISNPSSWNCEPFEKLKKDAQRKGIEELILTLNHTYDWTPLQYKFCTNCISIHFITFND